MISYFALALFISILVFFKENTLYNVNSTQVVIIPPKRYYYKNNNANYTVLADFGDELCLLREDINVRILMKRVDFEKYLKEIV
jgi:hypothetical protein